MKKTTEDARVVVVKLDLEQCEHGHEHIVDAEVLADSATVYEAPEARGSSVGWGSTLDANWEAIFGPRKPRTVN